ncbi:MAG: hypothetical protein JWM34_3369 [Ilumatobacteraceae bacterium]|nr:hypothetical protein [Ilumatobacteraceae bacterium]
MNNRRNTVATNRIAAGRPNRARRFLAGVVVAGSVAGGAAAFGSIAHGGSLADPMKPVVTTKDYFLTIDGVKGESKDDTHKDEIHVSS